MTTRAQLNAMAQENIETLRREFLTDIREVSITGSTPPERLESVLRQMKNPYCFRVGETPVRISFCGKENLLEHLLLRYFLSLKAAARQEGPA